MGPTDHEGPPTLLTEEREAPPRKRPASRLEGAQEPVAASASELAQRAPEATGSTTKYPRLAAFLAVRSFFFRKAELRLLSNFADVPVTLRGVTYPTGEHCYHAHKYLHAATRCGDEARAQELTTYAERFRTGGVVAADGLAAKRAGGKGGKALMGTEMDAWTSEAEVVQLLICQEKVARPDVRACLSGTGEAYLLHQDNRAKADTVWGGKIPALKEKLAAGKPIVPASDLVGQNRLGLIWMRVRETLTAASPT